MSRLKIERIISYEILASNGSPTIQTECYFNGGQFVKSSISYGASAGSLEATVIFDDDPSRFNSKGMLGQVRVINEIIAPKLSGEFENLKSVDEVLLKLDNTPNKNKLGGNAILSVSQVVAKAFAKLDNLETYQYLQSITGQNANIPSPMTVLIEGGKHADDSSDIQEYSVSHLESNKSIIDRLEECEKIYHLVGKKLKAMGFSINVGNEGAYAPSGIGSNTLPLTILNECINELELHGKLGISIDAAASEFCTKSGSDFTYTITENKKQISHTSAEMAEYYNKTLVSDNLISREDFFAEDDIMGWKLLNNFLDSSLIIGDDLTVTNPKLLRLAIDNKLINAVIIKPNQIGTITETLDCCKLARENDIEIIVSHRGGGESNDDFIADLAVAVGAKWIKCGPTRGERVAKYNRLIEIERKIKSEISNQNFA